MKTYIYRGGFPIVEKSGVGKAIEHQEKMLNAVAGTACSQVERSNRGSYEYSFSRFGDCGLYSKNAEEKSDLLWAFYNGRF